MKIIIAGTRTFNDYELLKKICDETFADNLEENEIVSEGAKGADLLGERYAKEKGYKITRFIPDWNQFGKSAGPIRNREMAKYADGLIAFWDGESRGTKNMIEEAKREGLEVLVVEI